MEVHVKQGALLDLDMRLLQGQKELPVEPLIHNPPLYFPTIQLKVIPWASQLIEKVSPHPPPSQEVKTSWQTPPWLKWGQFCSTDPALVTARRDGAKAARAFFKKNLALWFIELFI